MPENKQQNSIWNLLNSIWVWVILFITIFVTVYGIVSGFFVNLPIILIATGTILNKGCVQIDGGRLKFDDDKILNGISSCDEKIENEYIKTRLQNYFGFSDLA